LASHFFSASNDLEQARIEVKLARRTMPNSSDLETTAGSIARRQSHWDDAVRYFEKALTLDPRANAHRYTLANTYRLLRRYSDYDRLMTEVINSMPAKDPTTAAYRVFRAFGPFEGGADLGPFRASVNALSPEDDPKGRVRDFHHVILGLADHDADAISRTLAPADASIFIFNGVAYPKSWYEGLAARILGDAAGAKIAFTAARGEVEKAVLIDVTDGRTLSLLAMIDAGLGHREAAVREAQRACDLDSFENEGLNAPIVRCNLAVVYAWTGQPDLAIAELDKLVGRPAGANIPAQPTYGDFRLNPLWDPLRSDPRFEALVQRLAPVASK
jgi:tetratricopeptide (TPR) repeat protein